MEAKHKKVNDQIKEQLILKFIKTIESVDISRMEDVDFSVDEYGDTTRISLSVDVYKQDTIK